MEKSIATPVEAKKLSDVAVDAMLSDGPSKCTKTNLEDVSTDFGNYGNSKLSYMDSDSVSDDMALSEKDASDMFDSPELSVSMSDSHDNEANGEANEAKKQLLSKILTFTSSGLSRNVNPTLHERFESSQQGQDFGFDSNDGGFRAQTSPAFDIMERNDNANARTGGSEAATLEIDRLTDMLKDRRHQFRDLVRQDLAFCTMRIKSE